MGKIILIGGAEDKRGKKDILNKIVELSESKIIGVCTSALKENPLGSFESYKDAFVQIGAKDVVCFDIRNKSEADYPENIEKFKSLDTIFFTGGDQVRLKEIFEDSEFLKLLKNKIESGEINYCGSSAGSMIAAETIIYDGDYNGLIKGAVKYARGFGIVKNTLIDTHFLKRLRLERISQILLSGIETKGIGLAENTGIIIDGTICEIIGKNCVTFLDSSNVEINLYKQLKEDDKIPVVGLSVTMLNSGDKFCLKTWSPVL